MADVEGLGDGTDGERRAVAGVTGKEATTMANRHGFRSGLAVVAGVVGCAGLLGAAPNKVRIIQTNSAGDNVEIIDPATNRVVGQIEGVEANPKATLARVLCRRLVSKDLDFSRLRKYFA